MTTNDGLAGPGPNTRPALTFPHRYAPQEHRHAPSVRLVGEWGRTHYLYMTARFWARGTVACARSLAQSIPPLAWPHQQVCHHGVFNQHPDAEIITSFPASTMAPARRLTDRSHVTVVTPTKRAADQLAAGVLVGLLSTRLARSALGGLVMELDRPLLPGELQASLARTLGDPSLQLLYPREGQNRWVDAGGRTAGKDGHGGGAARPAAGSADPRPGAGSGRVPQRTLNGRTFAPARLPGAHRISSRCRPRPLRDGRIYVLMRRRPP